MVDIIISVNNGNEAFGTSGKTLTVNEQPKNISLDFVAEELSHKLPLVPKDVIKQVLTGFQEVTARMIAEGFAIQGTNTQGDVLLRYYVDAHLDTPTRNINLQKARELMPDVVTDEASMVAHAGELVALAGVTLRPYVEVQKKMHELLAEYKPKYEVRGTKEVAYVQKKDSTGTGTNTGGDNGGGSNGGGGNNNPPGELEE